MSAPAAQATAWKGSRESFLGLDLTGVTSSYQDAQLGFLFYGLARTHAPRVVVELGTYRGYSALHLAAALRDDPERNHALHLIDLWDRYPYRHCSLDSTREAFARNALLEQPHLDVQFHQADALESAAGFEDASIDLLHIDISNTGDNLRELLERWGPRIARQPNALIVVEGGSAERDRVAWMREHEMTPIRHLLESDWLNERYRWFCLQPFPSITLLRSIDDSLA